MPAVKLPSTSLVTDLYHVTPIGEDSLLNNYVRSLSEGHKFSPGR